MRRTSLIALCLVVLLGLSVTACRKKGAVDTVQHSSTIDMTKIYFGFDKYNLSSESQAILEQHAAWLKEDSGRTVTIEGNTDNRGTDEYNLALGERRANAAKNYLINLGISADRISTISYGESRPVAEGNTEADHALNRRDEFKGNQ